MIWKINVIRIHFHNWLLQNVHYGVTVPQLLFITTLAAKSIHKIYKYREKEILMLFSKYHYTTKKQWCSVLHCHNPEDHNMSTVVQTSNLIKWGNYMNYRKEITYSKSQITVPIPYKNDCLHHAVIKGIYIFIATKCRKSKTENATLYICYL
jgi:hypothetical protein